MQFYRVKVAAEILDVSPATVYREVGAGALTALRIRGAVRIPEASLLAYVREREIPSGVASAVT
ncbi:excisionase family DNA binding protein [Actinoalloteichus hoggarensis]|uniref:Helix-turn-helix domain protein n=1 Tax=Actinoalloteichus hoggarensis TaxID=1470176 RepID=A0A221W5T6_9PSEU|nr:helix-turn-helix domain-containing protein [Actinoalloteichus hoggarensis]ASO21071.1 Helix-turn-helix domain protein [Actinoalloteichus hoggarensis]MBB5921002.1 excisionase family DNA binding protein [Actinoalloteichus hoggarensis]